MWYFYLLAFSLPNVLRTTTPCTFATSQLQKVLQTRQFLTLLASKCASRHNGVHFFITSTSKSGPKLRCFVHFDFEMCFAPQRRAIFRHLNFQKWSASAVFCTFWLGNVLRAAMACTFATSQLPKVLKACRATAACNFSFLISPGGSAPAALASLLFTLRSHKSYWKNTVFRHFSTFWRTYTSSFF